MDDKTPRPRGLDALIPTSPPPETPGDLLAEKLAAAARLDDRAERIRTIGRELETFDRGALIVLIAALARVVF